MTAALRTLRGYRARQLAARAVLRGSRRLPWGLRLPATAPPLDPATLARLAEPDGTLPLAPPDAADPWAASPDVTALEAFERHYHAWLVPPLADVAGRERAWTDLAAWLERFPPSRGGLALAWHPYVVSSRVRPWAALLEAEPPPELAEPLTRALWQGLALLVAWPERDVAGNHELRNATALAAGAALFTGPQAAAMRQLAERRLATLVADQLGADGGHVERSTGYHAQVAGDLLDVLATAPAGALPDDLADSTARALGWLAHVAPPGRPRPELNDSGPAIGASTEELLARAAALGLTVRRAPTPLTAPRLVVLGDADTRLLVDCDQPTRPDLPYHAHADSLAVLLMVDGVPLLVDRGVATYEAGPERDWWRSTAAHSTVVPAGGDTSKVHGAFRAGRLARTEVLDIADGRVAARHDGGGRPALAHARRVRQIGPAAWTIWDAPAAPTGAVARFHLPSGAAVELLADGARVAHEGVRLRLRVRGAAAVERTDVPHALGFGRTVDAPTLDVRLADAVLESTLETER